jgi:hypothetical protein
MKFLKFCAFASLAILTACPGTRTGNPDVIIEIAGTTTPTVASLNGFEKIWERLFPTAVAYAPFSVTDGAGNTIDFSEALASIENIEFKRGQFDQGGETPEISLEGPFFVDLLASSPQELGTETLTLTGYRRVKMKLHKPVVSDSGAPVALGTNSLYLAGTINMNAFSFSTDEETEMEISGSHPITPNSADSFLTVINLGDLVEAIDLTDLDSAANKNITTANPIPAVSNSDPCPTIQDNADDLFTCFRQGLEHVGKFGRDDNHNGHLDGDESSSGD